MALALNLFLSVESLAKIQWIVEFQIVRFVVLVKSIQMLELKLEKKNVIHLVNITRVYNSAV